MALKAGASYFSYGSEHNFEWHKTAKEAVEAAEAAIDDYRGDACDGWSEEVDSICWGIIMQSSTMVGERPRTEEDRCDSAIDTICDYALLPAIDTTATAAAADVLAERKRQVTTEGWTPEHDDQHVNFEMAIAGGLYAISAVDSHHKLRNSAPSAWPWDRKWWKPDGPRRDLVKAGALILAEIERLDRAAGIKVEAE
ncbi:TPA: hypothetical protein ACTW52_003022 [Klebsiella quasipneumoniae subsp. similipneumoniae]|uniref:hypothetical protein n=1 Tax=Klebsiella quasipneumoniae TaxID=1463165 RepID=UPI002DBCA0BF|nr:hypothetical protein [Klebsiella quasipneumoniae]MEB5577229.1 hypothetical protein [Klebsiella quasipneumoniae]MEB5743532.1 hypothetical protein [Klebsiella quasipneumoniae]